MIHRPFKSVEDNIVVRKGIISVVLHNRQYRPREIKSSYREID